MKEYSVSYKKLKNGISMAYRMAGKGDRTVLLLHGNQSSSYFFGDVMRRLQDTYTLIAPDLTGLGRTDFVKRNSFREFAEDVALFVQAMGLGKFSLLGWSMGGGVAMELSAMMPYEVEKLVLSSSVSVKGYAMYGFGGAALPFMTRRLRSREDVEKEPVTVLPVARAIREKDRHLMRFLWDQLMFNIVQPEDSLYDALLDEAFLQRNTFDVNTALVTFNMTRENNGAVDGSGNIELMSTPVAIIHGSNDLVISFEYARENRHYLRDLEPEFYEIPHAGHCVFLDQPEEYEKAVREALKL